MRVLVTGGTGFVGSHTIAALAAAGHEVRLLVRSPDRIAPALAPHGISGDVDHRGRRCHRRGRGRGGAVRL